MPHQHTPAQLADILDRFLHLYLHSLGFLGARVVRTTGSSSPRILVCIDYSLEGIELIVPKSFEGLPVEVIYGEPVRLGD